MSGCSSHRSWLSRQPAVTTKTRRKYPALSQLACWLLLLGAAAHASAEPAAAAASGKDITKPTATGTALAQPLASTVLDYEAERPAVPRAESAVLEPDHPISKVVSCLGKVEGPIYPANSTAYEEKQQMARCGLLQHDALSSVPHIAKQRAAAHVAKPYAMHLVSSAHMNPGSCISNTRLDSCLLAVLPHPDTSCTACAGCCH
jgi:hypothetical protein